MLSYAIRVSFFVVIGLTVTDTAVFAQDVPSGSIVVTVSASDKCGVSSRGFTIYIQNADNARRISANMKFDTAPSGLAFPAFDSQRGATTEQYPRFYEFRLASGERRAAGCSIITRPGPAPATLQDTPMAASLVGAVYVSPSAPQPPSEDPVTFLNFSVERLPNNKSCLSNSPGFLILNNLHPSRRIAAKLPVINGHGKNVGTLLPDVGPFGSVSVGCTAADSVNFSTTGVGSAKFTTP